MKGQPDGRPRCLRCKTIDLTLLDSSTETISFFECPQCFRNYAQKRGGRLCFRWLHPISLALYPVIFEKHPLHFIEQLTACLSSEPPPNRIEQGSAEAEHIKLTVQEIRLELDDPTQQVRDILDCEASEEDLREYLRHYAAVLEARLPAIGS